MINVVVLKSSFNINIVECKYVDGLCASAGTFSFNINIVECKYIFSLSNFSNSYGF